MIDQLPFAQPRQKLARAAWHIRSLEDATREYFETDWYSCDFSQAPSDQYILKVMVRGSPRDFGLIVGDAVHNLRAALDLLAVEVVARNGANCSDLP